MPLFYRYKYDQLNRIVAMQAYKGLDGATNTWTAVGMNDYKEAISYDPNGNIETYNRKGAPTAGMPLEMDDLNYGYYAGTNKLRHVGDNVNYTNNYTAANGTEDIDNQTNPDNYTYDKIGNLTGDDGEHLSNVTWSVYGKILSIQKPAGLITYEYDASGNRVSKTAAGKTTLYARDASGNVMSVYESVSNASPVQKELHLYGSSRIGMATELTLLPFEPTGTDALQPGFGTGLTSTFTRGEKLYELSNHLGNVLETISDRKNQHTTDNTEVDYYLADVMSAGDYYPFGMGFRPCW